MFFKAEQCKHPDVLPNKWQLLDGMFRVTGKAYLIVKQRLRKLALVSALHSILSNPVHCLEGSISLGPSVSATTPILPLLGFLSRVFVPEKKMFYFLKVAWVQLTLSWALAVGRGCDLSFSLVSWLLMSATADPILCTLASLWNHCFGFTETTAFVSC